MDGVECALESYRKISHKQYEEAIVLLTKAISIDPADKRLYVNRCFCHLCLKDVVSANIDAKLLTKQFPDYANGWYLMGEVKLLQNKFDDAESNFQKSLQFKESDDTKYRLFEAQMQQIMKKGFEPGISRIALKFTSSVTEATDIMHQKLIDDEVPELDLPQILSESEANHFAVELDKVLGTTSEAPSTVKLKSYKSLRQSTENLSVDPLLDTSNPLKCATLWVGNITDEATESQLKKTFSKFGAISSMHLYPEKKCAFINYLGHEAASLAIKHLQGIYLNGTKLLIKFPDKALTKK